MTEERVQRRLAAILAADVVGYSRLMEADETGTLEQLKTHRRVTDTKIGEHRGRIVKTTGDGLLVEFPSVADAVSCALDVQSSMAERNSELPKERRMEFRIGINLGDVMIEGDDIFGNGVNVAARLQALAEPGGICISQPVYDQVRHSLDLSYDDLGLQEVKNIADPVQAYRVLAEPKAAAAASLVTEAPALEFPDKPSIAVLAFKNMSGDPEQEYFSDGISEDIITALSRVHWLLVIAQNSSFTYKGQAIDIKHVARDLGVRYVVEGSVRKAGSRVRVTAQLIDATNGNHLWADRYDRELDDIFAIQDEITETIVGNIDNELRVSERDRARRKPPASLGAWDLYQRGMWHVYKYTKEDNEEARRLFGEAIEQDQSFALPHAGLAHLSYLDVMLGFADDSASTLVEGLQAGELAIGLDDRDALTHFGLGRVATLVGKHDLAIAELEKAVAVNPSYAHANYALGFAFLWAGRAADGIPKCDMAIRLSPHDPTIWAFLFIKAWCHYQLENYGEAEHWAREAIRERTQEFWPHSVLAVVLVQLDRLEEARVSIAEVRRLKPGISVSLFEKITQYQDAGTREKFIDCLRKVGLPD